MLLEANDYNKQYKLAAPMPAVRFITIHNTANKAPAINERNYLNNRRDKKCISFHYAVDEKEAIQIMPHNIHAWHAGDGKGSGNMESIGIEICRSTCRNDKDFLYRQSEENAVALTAWLLARLNLAVDDLRMHYDWNHKNCPHRIIDENRWDDFKAHVKTSMNAFKLKQHRQRTHPLR